MAKHNYPVFDGHNDALENLAVEEPENRRSLLERGDKGHIDFPRAKEGGLAGGLFAVYTPSDPRMEQMPGADLNDEVFSYDLPMAEPVPFQVARDVTLETLGKLFRLEKEAEGSFRIARDTDELRFCFQSGETAVVIHFEGAEAVDPGLDLLYLYYEAGLRSLGPVWSRQNAFATGVPYKFPHGPDTGPGLSDAGKALVRECNDLGILVDLSHMNEKGFWDTANLTDAPLAASHSGAYELCPSTRNLTDKQLDAIGESGGIVGINFVTSLIRKDGRPTAETPLSVIADHFDYIAERIGIDHVGFGSDFDGGTMPEELRDVAGLPRLVSFLEDRGYDEAAMRKITLDNWMRVLAATWK